MPEHQRIEKNENIAKRNISNFAEFLFRHYIVKYPTKTEMGILKFQLIKLERLSKDHYFMVGKWQLTRQVGNIEGFFTLIWKKIDNDWVIISDHSS